MPQLTDPMNALVSLRAVLNQPQHPLASRLDAITAILVAHHRASAGLPSASKGADREVLIREFLSQVYPPQFRFGSGAIVDATGSMSGQLDIVIEFPFLPSFPAPGGRDRLYLAESVGVVLEVKSNLSSQWRKVQRAAKEVLKLRRDWRAHGGHDSKGDYASHADTTSRIPYLVVSFTGPKTVKSLTACLAKLHDDSRPDAVFVIDSGVYSGCKLCHSTVASSGAAGMLAFANDLAWLVRNVVWAAPRIGPYLSVVGGKLGV